MFGKGEYERKEGRRSRQEKDMVIGNYGRKRGRKAGKKGKEKGSNQGWIKQKEGNKEARGRLRPRPHVYGYFRIRNFFVADTAIVHTYTANSTANP